MSQNRTLEERIKFDHGLPIGDSLVSFTLGEQSRLAVVNIGNRGIVQYLIEPQPGDMYTSWTRCIGDNARIGKGNTIVWGARDPEIMAMFTGQVVATIPVQVKP